MMNFQDLWNKAYAIPGHFNREEGYLLWQCAQKAEEKFTPLPMLEIGSFRGTSATVLADVASQLLLIEPSFLFWDASKEGGSYDGTSGRQFRYTDERVDTDSRDALKKNMQEYGNRVMILPMKTVDVVMGFFPLFSLVFIDGNHTEGGIDVDCEKALPHLVKGGYACFHDYHATDYPFVTEMVDKYCAGWEFVEQQGSLGAFIKP